MCNTDFGLGVRQQKAIVQFAKIWGYDNRGRYGVHDKNGAGVLAVVVVGGRVHGQRTCNFVRLDVHRIVDSCVQTQDFTCELQHNTYYMGKFNTVVMRPPHYITLT